MTHNIEIFAAGLAAGIALRPMAAAAVTAVLNSIKAAIAAFKNPPPKA